MCGIAGLVSDQHLSEKLAQRALDAMRLRGPDARGEIRHTYDHRQVWMGHTRLAIQDLSDAGAQPMRSANGRWWLSFNGEIFNHLTLRARLHRAWRGHSDTETLVELIAAEGVESVLPLLNGMFAFAALDTQTGKLFLARDPFGIKPVYYRHDGMLFGFASSIRALGALCNRAFPVDLESLQTFLTLRFVPSPHSLLEGVSRVPAGHCIQFDPASGDLRCQAYVRPVSNTFSGTLDDAVEVYTGLIRQAVQRQMLSDVPVGVFLSGGVDSAFVAALAAEQGTAIPCFSVGFGAGVAECELSDAAETARVLGLPFVAAQVDAEDLWRALPLAVAATEEPLGTTSMLPIWHLAARARQDVTVVLTGQGSDEPLGGYRRYRAELLFDYPGSRAALGLLSPILDRLPRVPEALERAVESARFGDMARRFESEYSLFSPRYRELLRGNRSSGRSMEGIGQWLTWAGSGRKLSNVESMMQIDARMGLADDLLLYGDKISMAHSLEARVPMLDPDLVAFVESLPRHYKLSFQRGKIVHKIAAERYLPAQIVHRPKKGFAMPFGSLLRTHWRDRVEEKLFDPSSPGRLALSEAGLRRLWDEHQSGFRDRSRQLFALLALRYWAESMNDILDPV